MIVDLKYAFRLMCKSPGFSFAVILILALGIGANITEFSLTNAVLVKALPWPKADRLTFVWYTAPLVGWPVAPVSIPAYLDMKDNIDAFEDAMAFAGANFNLATGHVPQPVVGLRVTKSFFSTLGSNPALGRSFVEEEMSPGRDKVAIVSYDLWQTQLGGRADLLGTDLRLDGENYQLVGIMPKGFVSPHAGLGGGSNLEPGIWVPYAFTAEQKSEKGRGNWNSIMIARLKPGVSLEEVQDKIDRFEQQRVELQKDRPPTRKEGGQGLIVVNYRVQIVQSTRAMLIVLQAAVGLVLLIACGNVANLLLSHANARKREMAIRGALGAGRWRLARQIFIENLLLVAAGGAVGIIFGNWGLGALSWFPNLPNHQPIAVDGAVLAFALAISTGSGLLIGVALAVSLCWSSSGDGWREGNAKGSSGQSVGRTRSILIVGEVALALMLLVAAGLTLKSFAKLQTVEPGFSPEGILTAQFSLPTASYPDLPAKSGFYAEVLRRLRALPGVKSASAVSQQPFGVPLITTSYSIKGFPAPKAGEAGFNAQLRVNDPAYFQTLRIPLVRGRLFSEADTATKPRVVIIDQFMAARWFHQQDPVGRQIRLQYDGAPWCTIVGVVGSVKTTSVADPVTKETIYFPLAQMPFPELAQAITLVLRTDSDPKSLVAPLTRTIHELDPELPLFGVQTLDQRLADSLTQFRSPTVLLTVFGATALFLASLGLYGLLAYAVSQRTREIGIRIALGAQAQAIITLVVGQGLRLTLFGLGLGLAASLGLGGLLRSLLFGISAGDPAVFVAIPGLLLVVALAACYLPARRATRIDPIVALRAE